MSEPTLPELMRRLDEVVKAQERLLSRLDTMLGDVARTYASKESIAQAERSTKAELALRDQRLGALEDDYKDAAGFRRQVAAGFIVGFLLLLVPLLSTVTKAIGAG